ncbi:rhodopsin [Halobacteriales archaeon QH_9_66_26]|nr:MAG: rhodopsin [Halobacteriales archaeon QH_9_66_26]
MTVPNIAAAAFVRSNVLLQQSVEVGGESLWLWLGTLGMFLGMLAFIGMGWGETDRRKQDHYIITIFIPAIAFTMYLAMALGFGLTSVSVGGETLSIYWARYADWVFTTPLLLLDLALLVGASRNAIATLVGLDVAMIGTGLIATLTGGEGGVLGVGAQRLIWWGISTAFLLVLLYLLFGPIDRGSGDASSLFGRLRTLLVILWLAYPVLWLIGTEGLGLLPLFWETAAFMVLDLTAKVGFGYILLQGLGAVEGSRRTPQTTTTAD